MGPRELSSCGSSKLSTEFKVGLTSARLPESTRCRSGNVMTGLLGRSYRRPRDKRFSVCSSSVDQSTGRSHKHGSANSAESSALSRAKNGLSTPHMRATVETACAWRAMSCNRWISHRRSRTSGLGLRCQISRRVPEESLLRRGREEDACGAMICHCIYIQYQRSQSPGQ